MWRSPLITGSIKRKKTDRVLQQSPREDTLNPESMNTPVATQSIFIKPHFSSDQKILCDNLHFFILFMFSFFFLSTYLTHVYKNGHRKHESNRLRFMSQYCP